MEWRYDNAISFRYLRFMVSRYASVITKLEVIYWGYWCYKKIYWRTHFKDYGPWDTLPFSFKLYPILKDFWYNGASGVFNGIKNGISWCPDLVCVLTMDVVFIELQYDMDRDTTFARRVMLLRTISDRKSPFIFVKRKMNAQCYICNVLYQGVIPNLHRSMLHL